jgi:hypothetical protein
MPGPSHCHQKWRWWTDPLEKCGVAQSLTLPGRHERLRRVAHAMRRNFGVVPVELTTVVPASG